MHPPVPASSVQLFLEFNKEFDIFRNSKSVLLPDVVATLSSEENLQEAHSQHQDKIILEKLEEENLRLKAIFKLHSIKINESEEEERRRSSDSSQLSSSSSEGSSPEVQQSKVRPGEGQERILMTFLATLAWSESCDTSLAPREEILSFMFVFN